MGRVKKNRQIIVYALVFLCFFLGGLIWTAPLGVVNYILPKHVKMLNTKGNIQQGGWQDVEIYGKKYPLHCRYQRQSWSLSRVAYLINCETPLSLEGAFSVGVNGDVELTDMLISGEIGHASPWLALLGVPIQVTGSIGLTIPSAKIESQKLTYFDISGGSSQLNLFGTPVLYNVRLETLNKELSVEKPILLEARTKHDQTNSLGEIDDMVQLYLTSQIDGINYQTTGEVSGRLLSQYATFLRFFGQQTAKDRFAIDLRGQLF